MLMRSLFLVMLFGATALLAARPGEAPAARKTLAALPVALDDWRGHDTEGFADDVVSQLGVDEYINRIYVGSGSSPIALYVGYYASQRQGDTIHSPQNCLPGAGWRPIDAGYLTVPSADGPARVNRYVIQKGTDRQVVLYWYQGRGRVVANEYANKFLLMWDAARLNRTDGALIRVISPVREAVSDATATASRFSGALLPRLPEHIP
jgi:EpsI family protein